MKKPLAAILTFLLIFYALAFVWPTRWKYDHLGVSPIRTCRVTGHLQFATLQGWVDQFPIPEDPSK